VRWYGRPWRLDQRPINPLPLAISKRWESAMAYCGREAFRCGPESTRTTRAGIGGANIAPTRRRDRSVLRRPPGRACPGAAVGWQRHVVSVGPARRRAPRTLFGGLYAAAAAACL
jgi:hypothetical protein